MLKTRFTIVFVFRYFDPELLYVIKADFFDYVINDILL
jgi:hypothetical protein